MSRKDFKLLVMERDDLYLPKGWISAVYHPGSEPSEYEASEQSPWKVVSMKDNPIHERKRTKKDKLGKMRFDQSEVDMFIGNSIKKKKRKDVHFNKKNYARHNKPSTLPSGSTIWDYGPGRTYANPQAAFDALLSFQGASQFTDKHIIRGWTGKYVAATTSDPVLHIHGLVPTPVGGNEFVIDVEDGESVSFEECKYGIIGPLDDQEAIISDIHVQGLTIRVAGLGDDIGIASALPGIGGVLPFTFSFFHSVEDCNIYDGSGGGNDTIGFLSAKVIRPVVDRCRIMGFDYCLPSAPWIERLWSTLPSVKNSIIQAHESAFYFNHQTLGANNNFAYMILGHSIVRSGDRVFEQFGDATAAFIVINSILDAEQYILYHPDQGIGSILGGENDGNFYVYGTAFGLDKSAPYSFQFYREIYHSDAHSFDQVDPEIVETAEDITIEEDSPVFTVGIGLGYQGINNTVTSRGVIDVGPYQESTCTVFDPLTCGYCLVQEVIDSTGVEPADLEKEDNLDLNVLLCDWIGQATNIIDEYLQQTFELDAVPEGIRRACIMMVSNVVGVAIQRRKAPIVRINDYSVKLVQDQMLTDEVKAVLDIYLGTPPTTPSEGRLGIGTYTRTNDEDEFDID